MQWLHLLFLHWPVPAESLRPLVPSSLEIDTFDGSAWVGLVPFTMRDVSPTWLPRLPIRGVTDFHECNVRTYVRCGDVSGVYFFSLDAASAIAVWAARAFWHLPYYRARIKLHREDDVVDYALQRSREPEARLRCRWRIGDVMPRSGPGSLAHFLTERYALLTTGRDVDDVRIGPIAHEPWPLREAEVLQLDDGLVESAGIMTPASPPVAYSADDLAVRAWSLLRQQSPVSGRR